MLLTKQSGLSLREPNLVNADLSSVIAWMHNTLGINASPTRIAFYEKYLNSKEKIESLAEYRKYILISKEVDDFLRVCKVFREYPNEVLFDKIKKIASGTHYREKNIECKDPSRNYLYELSIASKFIKAGFEVDVSGDCDIVVKAYDKTVFIECKRIKSEPQLTKRIKHANKQIIKRIGSSKKDKTGYVAIDVTDLIITADRVKVYENVEAFEKATQLVLKTFVLKYKEKTKESVNKRVLSVIFSISNIGLIQSENRNQIINCHSLYAVGCEKTEIDFLFNNNVLNQLV